MKNKWLYICLDMMITHIPNKLETHEDRDNLRELFDHYMVAFNLLTSRFQVRMKGLSGDDEGKAIFIQCMGIGYVVPVEHPRR